MQGLFMWLERTKENRSMRAKGMLKKLKHPEEEECLRFVPEKENFHQNEKLKRRHDRWLTMCRRTLLNFQQISPNKIRLHPKTQDYVDGREFSSSCHTKLMATSSLLIRP
ncbi:hypothetical protein ACTXT7_011691 [Hymenolepis weldensis]